MSRADESAYSRSLANYNAEKAREKAARLDPYHPRERGEGKKRRNRRSHY
jgi:hypothetical protein